MTGSGTLVDPYVIWDVNDLQAMCSGPYPSNAYYVLGCNIDAAVTATWNWNAGRGVFEGFIPRNINNGNFDGKYFKIQNLHEDWYAVNPGLIVGLFGDATGAILKNVRVLDCGITGYSKGDAAPCNAGILVGYMVTGIIQNCLTSGIVVSTCWDTAVPGHHHSNAGGLLGQGYGGNVIIQKCASRANVTSTGVGTGLGHAGGLVGIYGNGVGSSISDSYAMGSANGNAKSGGLVGVHLVNGTITRCFSTGLVTGGITGGLVGSGDILTTISFWDMQTSGQAASAGGTGKTTVQMKDIITFADAGWDISRCTANLNDGYPFLSWQMGNPPVWRITAPEGGNSNSQRLFSKELI